MKLKSREKILLVLTAIAVMIWIFDHFYYAPKGRLIKDLKMQVQTADQRLGELLPLTKGVESVETEVIRMEMDLDRLRKKTLRGEEFRAFLKHLARESDPLQMKVISLTPHEEKVISPEGPNGPTANQYKKVSVQLVLHSTYNKLGNYLKEVEGLPFLIRVDRLQVERNEETQPLLKVILGLTIYIVG